MKNLVKKFPILVQCFQTGSLMAAGDVTSQFLIERKSWKQYELHRSTRFFGIGFLFVAPSLRTWYGFLDKVFPGKLKYSAIKKVTVDQTVMAPLFLVVFLSIVGISQQKSIQEIKVGIQTNYKDIIINNWKIWPAVQLCNFAFIPLQHQVLVVQVFALFWNTYMAWKTNQPT